jgi:hypothetical protein
MNRSTQLPGMLEMTERDLQSTIVQAARMFGWLVAHHHDSRRQVRPSVFVGDADAAGLPDLVMVRRDRVLFVELKREKGRTTPAQDQWLDALAASGCVEALVVRPSDLDAFLAHLR